MILESSTFNERLKHIHSAPLGHISETAAYIVKIKKTRVQGAMHSNKKRIEKKSRWPEHHLHLPKQANPGATFVAPCVVIMNWLP